MTNTTTDAPKKSPTRKTADKAKAAASQVGESAREMQSAAVETAQQSYESTREALVTAGAKARDAAEQQPLLVLAGAVAFGVVIGMAVSNNRRN